jgi:hypothetical protein
VTTVYVTHDQIEAMTLGSRVAVLKDGELMQVDTPQMLFDAPDNLFVATFIGSPAMNLSEAKLVKDQGPALVFADYKVPVPDQLVSTREGLDEYFDKELIVGGIVLPLGFVIAVAVAVVMWVVYARTRFGFELQVIAELCQRWDVVVFTDEIYEHITYDGFRHVPPMDAGALEAGAHALHVLRDELHLVGTDAKPHRHGKNINHLLGVRPQEVRPKNPLARFLH